jgi:hypothetical protein
MSIAPGCRELSRFKKFWFNKKNINKISGIPPTISDSCVMEYTIRRCKVPDDEKQDILLRLMPLIKPELKGHVLENAEIKSTKTVNIQTIHIFCKTLDDTSRPSKSYQPISIKLHEGFHTSEFSQRSFSKISEEFALFIRAKCAQFVARTTRNSGESHTADYWVFPIVC